MWIVPIKSIFRANLYRSIHPFKSGSKIWNIKPTGHSFVRYYAQKQNEKELKIFNILKTGLGENSDIQVQDVSGGCGAMFKIDVSSAVFKGKSLVEQHRTVNQLLSSEIKEMHGLTLTTKPK